MPAPLFLRRRVERFIPRSGKGVSATPVSQAVPLLAGSRLAEFLRRLPALGPVLWLWRGGDAKAFDFAKVHAWHALHHVGPDGVHEGVSLVAHDGREVARLCLLPDSDYLGWERLLESASAPDSTRAADIHRCLRELAWIRSGRRWQAAPVRFQPLAMDEQDDYLLVAPVKTLSESGWRRVVAICRTLDAAAPVVRSHCLS
ncbi:hypothetical protein [Tahibacter amnicola]|uniref:Uncharacterized protein n=1 Tax=Tahibacter amnicola TaxID=2976241 RepID=A0ABY6BDG2_9GAMM|nr:hypothetical protein [Tahibacter amnicola]UXI67582.1 hypothetical protein N4264_23045 [Tahibacter amnicola]